MYFQNLTPANAVSLFVKNIQVFEDIGTNQHTILPFFADGYPGLMFQETANGLFVNPHNKKMPVFFLYGQTIRPIELVMEGDYRLIVFQLYPFVLKSFFAVSPKDLNDQCYDLAQVKNFEISAIIDQLQAERVTAKRIAVITVLLQQIFQAKQASLDFSVRHAIQLIVDNKGQYSISKLPAALNVTERTLERRFKTEVGLSPKQFSTIIRFQLSLEQLTVKVYSKLTDIVYGNGFADQSHFIKVFKAFTGKTPKKFRSR